MKNLDSVSTGVAGCPHCDGVGVRVAGSDQLARAEVCSCVVRCAPGKPVMEGCDGYGTRRVRIDGVMRTGRCRCMILPDRARLFTDAGVPARHARSTFTNFRHDPVDFPGIAPAYHASLSWVEEHVPGHETRGLVLHGDVGVGKTHLLVAIVRALTLQQGVRARFVEFSHLLAQIKAGFDSGKGESQVLGPLVQVPVLAIDELGKGRGTDWEVTIIDTLISQRYNAMRTTLATTNYSPAASTGTSSPNLAGFGSGPALIDRVGVRVFSRLREMCQFVPVRGDDFRSNPRRIAY